MPNDNAMTKKELIAELETLRLRVAELEARSGSAAFGQDIIDAAPNPMFYKDTSGVFTACNRAFAAFIGKPRTSVIGRTIADIAPGEIGLSLHAMDMKLMAGGGAKVYESRLISADGTLRDVLVNLSAHSDAEGNLCGMGGILTDITDLKRIQAALRDAEANYRSFVENASEGVFRTTRDGRFVSVNPSMVRLTRHASVGEFLTAYRDMRSQLFVDPEECNLMFATLLGEHSVERCEVRFFTSEQQVIWVSINAHTVCDEKGGVLFIEGTCQDITARKRAERRLDVLTRHLKTAVQQRTRDLENANRRLLELDELKSTFLSTVSHDLRTPLTSVLGFSKLIRRDFERAFVPLIQDGDLMRKAERIIGNLEIISREGERLTRLVNDFLDLTKIEAGQMHWNDMEVQPTEVVFQAVDAVSGLFAEKPDVELKVVVHESAKSITADPDRIVQVLVNLLNNACKFTDKGYVSIHADSCERGGFRVCVEDTGMGIAPEEQPLVFDKFNQVYNSDTLTNENRGTGLGLAICREIVAHYNGRIDLDSTPGRGSRFTVHLPASAGTDVADVPDAPVQ